MIAVVLGYAQAADRLVVLAGAVLVAGLVLAAAVSLHREERGS